MIPLHAVGGAAGAVGGIADSGFVMRMTRGRLWVAVLGLLLGGIVALNVLGLSLSSSTTGAAGSIDELERANAALGAEIDSFSSGTDIEALAAALGLDYPEPGLVRYPKVRKGDAARAAQRLTSGQIATAGTTAAVAGTLEGGAAPAIPEGSGEIADPGISPVAPAGGEVVAPVPEGPAVETPAPVDPAPAAAAPAASEPAGGGITP